MTSGGTTDVPLTFGDLTSVGTRVKTPAAAPIAGVCVDLYDPEDGTLLLGSAITNASGDAQIPGLTAGGYKLKFTDCGGFGFRGPVWYESKSGFALAEVVTADWPESPDDFPTAVQPLQMALEDTTPPGLPTFDVTNPASGANENDPEVIGTAEPGSSVQLYTDPSCTTPIGSSTQAASFASPGVTVRVGDNSTTTFHATATDAAGNTSSCSTDSIIYTESTPSTLPDDSTCAAARAKLAAATKVKSKAAAALKSAIAKEKPRPRIRKLKRKAKAARIALRRAAAEVEAACR